MKLDAILSREILPESEKNFVKKLEPDQTKTPEHTVQKKSASTSKLSGLFVDQQTDHSQYVRASLASSQASQKAMNNKLTTMTSLLQVQIAYEQNDVAENTASYFGPLDLSYSRRSRIGARAAALLERDMTKEVNRTTKLESEKDSERKEITSTDEALPVQDVSAGRPVASATPKVKSTPKAVSVSIRI